PTHSKNVSAYLADTYKYTPIFQKNQAFLKPIYDIFTKGLDFSQKSVYNKTYRIKNTWRVSL
ncbi:hypothetical protein, partial [Ruminococcus sp.]|uniref:hypothetical protein n=1 Tax=Ruminococcus sp. TaxID=41978 RepID=UPI003AF77767